MDYSFFIWSTATFIETRVKELIEYPEMEKNVGFSYRHIRETFKDATGISENPLIFISNYTFLKQITFLSIYQYMVHNNVFTRIRK